MKKITDLTELELLKELMDLWDELREAEQNDDVIAVIGLRKEIEQIEIEIGVRYSPYGDGE